MTNVNLHQIWVEQCVAAETIKLRYGLKAAFDYAVAEKLLNFAEAAAQHPEFGRELPRFVSRVRQMFTAQELVVHLARIERERRENDLAAMEDDEAPFENPAAALERTRQRTRAFSGLQSHYLFEDRYGRPGKGNDKGNVEGVVGYARRNFMTPLPRFANWDAFNGHLEEQCRNRQGNVLRGHRESIGERFVRDREALKRPLPAPFDACDKQGTRVNSLSLVRYRTNDYSVPVAYGHQEVWIRGYVHEVVIGCGAGIIARHPRSYDREDMVFDPIHYLPLLEHKIGALDQAAPLAGWELPDAFPTLRRLLEARMGKAGKREYVQVLRLVETFDLEVLHGAVKDALRLGAIGYDAVKHLVLCRIERRPPKLDLDIYPYLPRANVATTAAASYMSLLGGGAS